MKLRPPVLALVGSLVLIGSGGIYFAPEIHEWQRQRAWNAELAESERFQEQQLKFQARLLGMLPNLRVDAAYYVEIRAENEPVPASQKFHGLKVVSSGGPITGRSADRLKLSLARMIQTPPDMVAACYDPHHAISMSDGVEKIDVEVCFHCRNFRIFAPEGEFGFAFSADEASVWDDAFATAGLARPPEAIVEASP